MSVSIIVTDNKSYMGGLIIIILYVIGSITIATMAILINIKIVMYIIVSSL